MNVAASPNPSIAIVGAGAIGGYFGARLAQHGHDVTLIDAWPAHVETMRKDGLRIACLDPQDEVVVPVRALHVGDVHLLTRKPPIDVAIIAPKSYDTRWTAALVAPYVATDGCFVSMQNCINEPALADVVGWGRVVGCVVMLAAELIAPGHIQRTSGRKSAPDVEFRFGEPHGRMTARVNRLAAIASEFDGADVTANLWGERWSKLCFNALHNGVSAVTGLTGEEWKAHAPIRRFAARVGGEAVRTGQALGYAFDRVGSLAADRLARCAEDPDAMREVEHWMVAGTLGVARAPNQRPSLAQDLRKGRRSEIDFINGFVATQAASLGFDAKANAALTTLVGRVERGEVDPAPETLLAWA
jgi:2-dehydropantoate 2-reductase